MSGPRNESFNETNFVWGAKLTGSNYKSVTLRGELFALGDCVRCPLKSREGHVGKIVKLSQQEGRKMCRIRSFYSTSEFPPSVKGLDCTPEPKELFLASGEGPGVEKDVLLVSIAINHSLVIGIFDHLLGRYRSMDYALDMAIHGYAFFRFYLIGHCQHLNSGEDSW